MTMHHMGSGVRSVVSGLIIAAAMSGVILALVIYLLSAWALGAIR